MTLSREARADFPVGKVSAKSMSVARGTLTRLLLGCGILSSILYAAMLCLVPMQWEG